MEAAGRRLAASTPVAPAAGEVLTVVIAGDGAAHDRHGRPTDDPTPRREVGLDLARAWPAGPVAWLGRLCQFEARRDPACRTEDWTTGRFSAEAVASADAAVDRLKAEVGARRVRLVGWSGGGTLAALVAARRHDVVSLTTLAAPLNLRAWTTRLGLTPLTGSLDPGDLAPLPTLPQVHLYGDFDTLVSPVAARVAGRRLAGPAGAVETWPERHACCWARRTARILALIEAQEARRGP